MESASVSLLAGAVSTAIFTISYVPMLVRAYRTRDLRSYSFANLALANVGNAVHWLYVALLPFGPIWFLHGFYTITTALMLLWYLRQRAQGSESGRRGVVGPPPVRMMSAALPSCD